jgi:hypothetical protein
MKTPPLGYLNTRCVTGRDHNGAGRNADVVIPGHKNFAPVCHACYNVLDEAIRLANSSHPGFRRPLPVITHSRKVGNA